MDPKRPGSFPNDGRTVLDTSELRWFALGLPPGEVVAWFSAGGGAGITERRCDVYQFNGLHDIGLKRRFGATVEVKVRRAVGASIALGAGPEAPLEEWRKWVPSEGDPMWPAPDSQWIKVHKAIRTRTFMLEGGEVAGPASFAGETDAGCDVEVAALTVGGIEVWTFAFEAFGPRDGHSDAVVGSWASLVARSDPPGNLWSYFECAAGYPEWLDLVVSQRIDTKQVPRLLNA